MILLFIYFWGCVGSLLQRTGFLQLWQEGATLHGGARASHCGGFSCCGAWALGTQASVATARRLSSCSTRALDCAGFSSCGTWAQQLWCTGGRVRGLQQLWLTGSRAQAQQLWHTGLVAPWHVGSSRTRDQTNAPCIGRRILNHCATREVL